MTCLRIPLMSRRRTLPWVWWAGVVSACVLYLSGLYQYGMAWSYARYYTHWGPSHPLPPLMAQLRRGEETSVKPVNEFTNSYLYLSDKCKGKEAVRLMYVVKSALENFERRKAIRSSWGFESRFSDVEIRTVFLVGVSPAGRNTDNKQQVEQEAQEHSDIIQADFIDSYFNNTLKTMMGLHWTYHFCHNVKYFLFVDDDYYVSTRNMLRFLRDPDHYPHYLEKYIVTAVNEYREDLYAGYVFHDSSPIRWIYSKWYVSLDEYPYSKWPPYVTAGAYVLSRKSLEDLYFGSIYTNYFRFDDVFLGMAAKKAGVEPFHHKEFYFYRKMYDKEGFRWVVASHGFSSPRELLEVWNEQRSAGNA